MTEYQAGFRIVYGTVDNVMVLKELVNITLTKKEGSCTRVL